MPVSDWGTWAMGDDHPGSHNYRVQGAMFLLFGSASVNNSDELPKDLVHQLNELLGAVERIWVDREMLPGILRGFLQSPE